MSQKYTIHTIFKKKTTDKQASCCKNNKTNSFYLFIFDKAIKNQ